VQGILISLSHLGTASRRTSEPIRVRVLRIIGRGRIGSA
jgi:hypothetical protein